MVFLIDGDHRSAASPEQQPLGYSAETGMQGAQDQHEQHAECEAVEPVHQATMSGNDIAAVLDAEVALCRAFAEVAQLAENTDGGRDDETDPPRRIGGDDPNDEAGNGA